ncbi:MAG TPA: hypothetical protein VLE22_00210 [Bryobacteraceae bacterium]|nr:hypothetical protein [Bryobacteraceae bacterium]
MTQTWLGFVLLLTLQQAPVGTFGITSPTLHQFEDGPAIPAGHRFIPGETVFFSCQVQGYRATPEQKVRLSYKVDAVDADGVLLVATDTGKIDTELAPQDKEWMPKIRRAILIPPHAPPGQYRIVTTVKDEVGGQEAKTELSFQVHGRRVEPSDTLVVRNFRFLRSEQDDNPLPIAFYRPGNTLWARFEMTGFKIGEKNRVHVEYGIAILSPDGKQLFAQEQAAVEEDSPFYPKRYVPGQLSLNIQPKTPPGEYTLVVSVRDQVGAQTIETRQPFRIEE